MTISSQVLRTITIRGSIQGVTEAAVALGKLLATSDRSTHRQISAADAYNRQTLAVAREQAKT